MTELLVGVTQSRGSPVTGVPQRHLFSRALRPRQALSEHTRFFWLSSQQVRGSIVVSIPARHAGDPGSIPGRGAGLSHWRMGRGVEADWLPPA